MAEFRERPYSNFNFLVDLGTGDSSSIQAGFSEVILPEVTISYASYRNGNERLNTPRKITSGYSFTHAILKRGIIGALDLHQWLDEIRAGAQDKHRTVTIHLLSEDRATTAMTWKLINAVPVKYSVSPLIGDSKNVAIELIELSIEDMQFE